MQDNIDIRRTKLANILTTSTEDSTYCATIGVVNGDSEYFILTRKEVLAITKVLLKASAS